MNPTDLPSHVMHPAVGGIDATRDAARIDERLPGAISGNDLMGLDVWGGYRAGERTLGQTGRPDVSHSAQLEQIVEHILAPLG